MYQHERSLVEELDGQPFVLLGVNSDPLDRAQEAVRKNNLTWRSWWDGGDTRGPIASEWKVRGWPTIYLIDHTGVIRHKGVRGNRIDTPVKEMLSKVP